MTKISVIVPIYNVEKYISKCLDSIINQTHNDLEILCIDDIGNDNSMKIVEEYAQKDNRIKIIRHNSNKGLGCARNTGLKHATGKYIACVDSDDWIDSTMLEKVYYKLEELNLDSVWVKVNTYIEDEDRYTTDNYYKALFEHPSGLLEITPDNINNFPVNAWNKVYRSDFIKKNNIEWSKGLLYEDLEFYYQFYTRSHKTYLLDEMLYFYRWRSTSIMNQTNAGKCRCEDIYDVSQNIYNYLINYNLFDVYKNAFINLVVRNIKLFLYNPHYKERVINKAKELLKEINYPNHYSKNENDIFLKKVLLYNSNIKDNKILLFLINLIPIKKLRHKYRENLRKDIF